MFRMTLTILNPMTGESRKLDYQFDPATMSQTKWNGAYSAVQPKISELVAAEPTTEPPTW